MLPASFYKDQDRAKQRARVIKRTRFEEVRPRPARIPIRVDAGCTRTASSFPTNARINPLTNVRLLKHFMNSLRAALLHEITLSSGAGLCAEDPGKIRYLHSAGTTRCRIYVSALQRLEAVTHPRNTKPKPGPPPPSS